MRNTDGVELKSIKSCRSLHNHDRIRIVIKIGLGVIFGLLVKIEFRAEGKLHVFLQRQFIKPLFPEASYLYSYRFCIRGLKLEASIFMMFKVSEMLAPYFQLP